MIGILALLALGAVPYPLPLTCTGKSGDESYSLRVYADGALLQTECAVTANGKRLASTTGRPTTEKLASPVCVILNDGSAKGVDRWVVDAPDGKTAILHRIHTVGGKQRSQDVVLHCSAPRRNEA
jgi:hypothetical protein